MEPNQARLPLWEAISAYRAEGLTRLHVPGHKGVQELPYPIGSEWGSIAEYDVTELPQSDDLYAPHGPLLESQQLLACLYGTAESFYLVNGASVGLMAALMAVIRGTDTTNRRFTPKVLLPREAHRSLWQGCIIADLWPVSAVVDVSEQAAVPLPPTLESLSDTLSEHPDICAAVLLHPGYYGLTSDLHDMVDLLHSKNIPVIVDEAHGTHLRFLPMPIPDGLMCGADIVVQSPHKTAASLTQTAWMHCAAGLVKANDVRSALRLLQTSSPNFPLMLSLEAARHQLALQGETCWHQTVSRVSGLRKHVEESRNLSCLSQWLPQRIVSDPCRIYILTGKAGYSGYEAASLLHSWGISVELADYSGVLMVFTPNDSINTYAKTREALDRLSEHALPPILPISFKLSLPVLTRVLSPRQAWCMNSHSVPLREAAGNIAAEIITVSPPGVPLITPGELITNDLVELVTIMLQTGATVTGISSDSFMIKVVHQ